MELYEKDFEDWVADHPHRLFPYGEIHGQCARVVGRQVAMPHGGVADLLVLSTIQGTGQMRLSVVELKREKIDSKAVAQGLRYMGSLRYALTQVREHDLAPDLPLLVIETVMVAPRLSDHAALMVNAFYPCLRYVELKVSISANPWTDPHWTSPEDSEIAQKGAEILEPCSRYAPFSEWYPDHPDEPDDEPIDEGAAEAIKDLIASTTEGTDDGSNQDD